MRTVGILGGMGPEATILLQSRLLKAVDAQDDRDHLPLLIDMNPQVPSRLDWILENKGDDPGVVLAQMADKLAQAGADAIAMPCNTAHHFAQDIEQAISVPFLNMPKLAAANIANLVGGGADIGILASPATEITSLFANVLGEHGCEAVFPEDQDDILNAIRTIKSDGVGTETTQTLQREADKLVARGVKCIVVGCSEFSLLADDIQTDIPLIDTLDVLVDQIVTFSGAKKKGT